MTGQPSQNALAHEPRAAEGHRRTVNAVLMSLALPGGVVPALDRLPGTELGCIIDARSSQLADADSWPPERLPTGFARV